MEQSTIERLKKGLKLSSDMYTEGYTSRKDYLQAVIDTLNEDPQIMTEEDYNTIAECQTAIKDINRVLQYIQENDIIDVVIKSLVTNKDAPYTEGDVLKVLNFADDLESVVKAYQECLSNVLDSEHKPTLLN